MGAAGAGRYRIALLAGGVAAFLTVAPAAAQPSAVYEIDDYLDPRILGASIDEHDEIQPGNRFLVTELLAGTIADFEHLGGYTDGLTEFAHLLTSAYLGRHQLNLLVTDFDPRSLGATGSVDAPCDALDPAQPDCPPPPERARFVPDYRVRLQYGRYSAFTSPRTDESYVERWLVSAGYEHGPFGDVYDLGFVVDLPVEEDFLGSLGYDWRIVENGFDQLRILYFYSWRNERWKYWAAPIRISFGRERSEGRWRWAPVRLEASVRLKIEPLHTTLHLSYAPSYRPSSRGFDSELNHEFAAFLDVVALAKVFAPARRRAGR